jgi:hypothetical protein
MDELDKVLSQMKDEYSPDAATKQRVRASVGTALVAGTMATALAGSGKAAAAGGVSSASGSAAGSAIAGGSVAGASIAGGSMLGAPIAGALGAGKSLLAASWGKAVLGVALVSGVTGLSVTAMQLPWGAAEPSSGASMPSVLPSVVAAAQVSAAPRQQSGALAPASETPGPSLEQVPVLPHAAATTHAESANPVEGTHQSPTPVRPARPANSMGAERSTMLAELGLLQRASQAIRAGDAAQAKRALDEHARRFASSALAQEREGLSLLVRCNSAVSSQTRTDAERFVAQAPNAPLADSIRKQCLK